MKMKAGEKYLNIKLVGHEFVVAFPNKNKKNMTEPDFKGDGVAVWIRTKKEEKTEPANLTAQQI